MAEIHFTDITITGNNVAKPPRKEGRNKEGKDQFIITFTLSSHAKGPWIETFNRIWGEFNRKAPSIQLPIVSDGQVQLTCPLDDRLQNHLDNLKEVITTTNRTYRQQLQEADDEKRGNYEILQRLRF
ncbi:MAG TPA: hypothetical protein VFD58_18520 [Blastocatellia bacterium]|nr:hypothetical protein [Blastocatellia bacterium]